MTAADSPLRHKAPAIGSRHIDAAAIAALCEAKIEGKQGFTHISGVTTLAAAADHQLIFLDRFSEELCAAVNDAKGESILFILLPEFGGQVDRPAIYTEHPREVFSRLVIEMFDYHGDYWEGFEDSVAAQARLAGVRIFPGCYVHKSAQIGQGAMIFPGNVIGPKVVVGRNVSIRPCSAIGFPGYGIFRGSDRRNAHLPHVGGVVIGDDVEVGSFTTICSGTIHPTVIGDNAKIDDHVHIAHNCQIGEGARIIAHAEVSGSAVVGRNAWLAPNVSVLESVEIGENAFVGIAANVVKDVPANTMVVGNPAKVLRSIAPES